MPDTSKAVVIIPARGGSKEIPRKNIRLMAGKPLIAYVIQTAMNSQYVEDVFVSTEDEEIADISKLYGSRIVKRDPKLAVDDVTLDPVISQALSAIESDGKEYELVVTLQPTSPLLKTSTLDRAIELMMEDTSYDSLVSVIEERHLYWEEKADEFVPLHDKRENRQFLKPLYKETGAVVITRNNFFKKSGLRIGGKITLFVMPDKEAIDIDHYEDWWVAEKLLQKLNIVFRTSANNEVGMGHLYRALTLAKRLFGHNVSFILPKDDVLAVKKIKSENFNYDIFEDEVDAHSVIKERAPDIVINDILDTDSDYMNKLKGMGAFTVNFEDLGSGAELADLVVNALYEISDPPVNHLYGYKYVVLRDEFHLYPTPPLRKEIKNILITFGGTDPNNLTLRTLRVLDQMNLSASIKIILGCGYQPVSDLETYIEQMKNRGRVVELFKDVKIMAKHMYESDLIITSNGRTIYEVSGMQIPCISISQNERETRHLFSQQCKGILDLGIADLVKEEDITNAVEDVMEYETRAMMVEAMKKYDLRSRTQRVVDIIFEKYKEWENGKEGTV